MVDVCSSLVALAGRFTSKFAPYQAISIEPGPAGAGVLVAASNRGASGFVAFDPKGRYEAGAPRLKLLPTPELLSACRGIKTAERSLRLDGPVAVVSTYTKSTTSHKEMPVAYSTLTALSARDIALSAVASQIEKPGPTHGLFGRFDIALVRDAVRILEEHGEPVLLSIGRGSAARDGEDRPLRLFSESLNAMVIIMPMKKKDVPYPPPPAWLGEVGAQPPLSDSPMHPSFAPDQS
jgi:hypothetical protein